MIGIRHGLPSVVLALALASSSCHWFRRSKVTTPPAPKPASGPAVPAPPPRPAAVAKPPAPPQPPALEPQVPDVTQQPCVESVEVPPYRPPRRPARAREAAEAPKPAEAEAQPPSPIPQLEQILSPEVQQECNEAIDRSLRRARQNLSALGGKRLNPDQATSVERIRTFITQAVEARKTDLLLAKSLAERADVLSQDLLRTAQ